jgi:hypothetical protein
LAGARIGQNLPRICRLVKPVGIGRPRAGLQADLARADETKES